MYAAAPARQDQKYEGPSDMQMASHDIYGRGARGYITNTPLGGLERGTYG